jgi:hypothetical protein
LTRKIKESIENKNKLSQRITIKIVEKIIKKFIKNDKNVGIKPSSA